MKKILILSSLLFIIGGGCIAEQKQVEPKTKSSGNPVNTMTVGVSSEFDQTTSTKTEAVEMIPETKEAPTKSFRLCVDNCGNNKCESIVCAVEGCPCGETILSCPQDCS